MNEKKSYTWYESATGDLSSENLLSLRDETVSQLVELLWPGGTYYSRSPILELIAHGDPRKAAELAGALVEKYPPVRVLLRRDFRRNLYYLLDIPLEYLPSKLAEFTQDDNQPE